MAHGEVYSTKVDMDRLSVVYRSWGSLGFGTNRWLRQCFPKIRLCLQDITANFGPQET